MKPTLARVLTLILCLVAHPRAGVGEGTQPFISNVGRAPFAFFSPNFPCEAFLHSVRRLPVLHVATLYNSFGHDYRCFRKLKSDPRLQTFQLNLVNSPGQRNRRLGPYEFLAVYSSPAVFERLLLERDRGLKDRFTQYVKRAQVLIASLPPHVQCLINPDLEGNISDKAASVLVSWTRDLFFPRCRVIHNPLRASTQKVGRAGADLVEGHGKVIPVSAPCIVNTDGVDISFPERPSIFGKEYFIESGHPIQQWIATYTHCELVYLWIGEDNLIASSAFKDPRKRALTSAKARRAFSLVAREAEVAMKTIRVYQPYPWSREELKSLEGCTQTLNPHDGSKRGFLMKQSEFRDRGGVVLLPSGLRASRLEIAHKGKVIDRYQGTGSYDHDGQGREMWRSQRSPLELPLHVVVRASTGEKVRCWGIQNPMQRVD